MSTSWSSRRLRRCTAQRWQSVCVAAGQLNGSAPTRMAVSLSFCSGNGCWCRGRDQQPDADASFTVVEPTDSDQTIAATTAATMSAARSVTAQHDASASVDTMTLVQTRQRCTTKTMKPTPRITATKSFGPSHSNPRQTLRGGDPCTFVEHSALHASRSELKTMGGLETMRGG